MAKRLAELGALQDAITNGETAPSRLGLAGYIRGLFLDWSASPYNPLTRLSARGRLLGYFWDNGAIGLSMDFTNQNFIVKDGTLKSKSFSEIVNFTRTSNATVTRSDGTIGYAPHNLLTFSEQFDNAAWTKTTTTVSANAIASPTSTTTGDTLTAGGANSTTLHSYTAIAQPYTFSIYIRRRTGTGTIEITADGSTYVAKTITADWTRFDTTITPTAGTRTPGVRIVTSGDVIDVWGAQLEIGSTATTYNPTTVKNLLGFSELFDNAAWTKSNSFVQTNLLTYSEAFDNAVWNKGAGVSITANSTIAPNGYQTADTITFTGANQVMSIGSSTSISGLVVTGSIYVKGVASETIQIAVGGVDTIVTFTGEWQRVELIKTSIVATTNVFNINTFSGVTARSFTIWGAQLVQGSVAGDYRRTDAAALPVYYLNHNGVVCAEKLVSDTVNQLHYLRQDFSGSNDTTYTVSAYVKAGEWNSVQIEMITQAGNVKGIVVNLSTGVITVGRVAFPTSYGAIPVGNGWYRVWITNSNETGATSERVDIFATNNGANGSITGDGTSGIYIFGAQLSDSASLDPYVLNAAAAPTAAAYYGARFNYNPVTLQPEGLLIEEQRSNLLLNSGNIAAGWIPNSITATANNLTSPENTTTASLLVANAGIGLSPYVAIAGTAGSNTYSVFFKAGTHRYVQLTNGNSSAMANFDLVAGVTGTTLNMASSIQPYKNGWYRCICSGTTALTLRITIVTSASAAIAEIWSPTGTESIYAWGAQLEAGAFATSYIPTAASQVTRTADVATIQGSNFYSWYNQNEGSIVIKAFINTGNAGSYQYVINDGTGNNYIRVGNNTNTVNAQLAANGTNTVNIQTNIGIPNNYENIVAFAYKINDVAACGKPNNIVLDTSNTPPIVNQLQLGASNNNTIKSISYYPLRLSNDVLKGLTA